jgi:hypothetical protein
VGYSKRTLVTYLGPGRCRESGAMWNLGRATSNYP